MTRRIALAISFIAVNLMACCCGGVGNVPTTKPRIPDRPMQSPLPTKLDAFVARFGKPDEEQNKKDKKHLIYKEESFHAIFSADGDAWSLDECIESDTKKSIGEGFLLGRLWSRDTETKAFRDAVTEKAVANAKVEASKSPVTRANYNRVTTLMQLKDVEAILGPGKEVSRSGPLMTMVWRNDFGTCVISMVLEGFSNGWAMRSKSIIGD